MPDRGYTLTRESVVLLQDLIRSNGLTSRGRVSMRRRRRNEAVPVVPGGGGVAVEITAIIDDDEYTVDVYGDGIRNDDGTDQAATETGKTLFIDQIATGARLAVGTRLRATPIQDHYEAVLPGGWL